MRIDLDSLAYRPDFIMQKPSGEVHEMNARGENVRGRIIDVNQNIVLIQTSTGKQFSASTTVPMENFIDQEMSFSILIGIDGELILKPEIDEKNQRTLVDLKIEDMLSKLGKQVNLENKEIIKQMMKSSIPISKEKFEEIKELKFAMDLLKTPDYTIKLQNEDQDKSLNNLLKEVQTRKNFGIAEKTQNNLMIKDANLKDIILLKNLGLKVSINNIKSLYESLGKINSKNDDILGIKTILNDSNFINELEEDLKSLDFTKLDIKNDDIDKNISKNISLQNTKTENLKDEEGLKNIIFEDFSQDFKKTEQYLSKNTNFIKDIKSEDLIQLLKNIEKNLIRKIEKDTNYTKEDFEIEYEKAKDEIKNILNILSKESESSKIIQKQLIPKIDILSAMVEKYNYNIIPFKINENYDNVLQYYVKKGKKSLKNKDEINIGLSIDTKNYGNIKTMLNYDKKNTLKLDFLTEDKNIKYKFDSNISSLKAVLKTLGFSNIDIKVSVNEVKKDLIDDVLFDENKLKSFEMWI